MNLSLQGLDCANCALKVENAVRELENIKTATVNFAASSMSVELFDPARSDNTFEKIRDLLKKIEPDVKVFRHTPKANNLQQEDGAGFRKKFIFTLSTSGTLFLLGSISEFSTSVELGIFLAAYLIAGYNVLYKAAKNILSGRVFDENFLMSIATIGAFAIGQFHEGVAVMLFYKVGEFLQDAAVNRSRKSIAALMGIRPDYANLKEGEEVVKVSPEKVSADSIIIVKPGEKVPLDGTIIAGNSFIDASALTGESVPQSVAAGSAVLSGSINKTGLLTVKVTKEFGQSTVAKILDLVQNAGTRKAKTENFITKFAGVYTPAVVAVACLIACVPPLFFEGAVFVEWFYRALIFLIISCPCALVISIPLGFFGGIGACSRQGILVKGANYLEALNDVDTVVFDKTGTLTKGVFAVTQICPENSVKKELLLECAAYAESYSSHPIAAALIKEYGKVVDKSQIGAYSEIAGYGIKAKVRLQGEEKEILAGSAKLMSTENIIYNDANIAGTVVHVAIEREYAGFIIIADILKDDAKNVIQELRDIGVRKTVMLTGDNKKIAGEVAAQLKLDGFYAELLPHEKVAMLEELDNGKPKNKKLVFAGDGINDAPVLARADIGVAMGGLGSDAAVEAADVVIMTDEPSKIVAAIKLAKTTKKIIWQNIAMAMGIKLLVMLLGVIGMAAIWEAVIADVGVAILAVLNAMRILNTGNIKTGGEFYHESSL